MKKNQSYDLMGMFVLLCQDIMLPFGHILILTVQLMNGLVRLFESETLLTLY